MSLGFGASCKLIAKDEDWYLYAYTSYNINLENYKSALDTCDGIIMLHREYFPAPEIVRKRKKKPNGKKVWIEKKKYRWPDSDRLWRENKIRIENSSHCWKLNEDGIDVFAFMLIYALQSEYREKGEIPVKFGIFS